MTPKEKAKELVDKFARIDGYQDSINLSKCEYEKQCALIAVDEILDRLMWHTGASDLGNTIIVEDIRYLMEVKQEIEKL
jgi:hypothetical protein